MGKKSKHWKPAVIRLQMKALKAATAKPKKPSPASAACRSPWSWPGHAERCEIPAKRGQRGRPKLGHAPVTASAYSQAHNKLRHTAFIELNRTAVVGTLYGDGDYHTFWGFRVLAVDGSKIALPDSRDVRTEFVAIGRATRWVFMRIYDDQTEVSSVDFLGQLVKACPVKIEKVLTDNGSQFTDRFTSADKQATGRHAFDRECARQGIEHRLIPPRRPEPCGQALRFNGHITEVVAQTRFASAAELEKTLYAYLQVYNRHIHQRALGHQSPAPSPSFEKMAA